MLDSAFQLLFNHRPAIFQQGELRLAPSTGSWVAAAVVVAAIAITFLTYRAARSKSGATHRLILAALRTSSLLLVLFCLFRPVLVMKAAVPQQNFLGILIDDSRSMQIADVNGAARGVYARERFGAPGAALLETLSDRFVLRTFRFSSSATRLAKPDDLTFAGAQTKLGTALDGARQELAGLPLAGLVVVSDGADTTDVELTDALLAMKASSIPVFTVGVGQETLTRDIQIDRVSTPRTALKGTSLMIDVVVTQTGYAGESVMLDVEDDGRIVGSQDVKLPIDGEPAAVRVRFTASDAGARLFKFRIAPREGELVTQNNQREALIDVRDSTERILYFEGELRPEMKFLRRAVDEDSNLKVVALQRTADNKYYRLGVEGEDELIAGFPKTREELFAYRGLILGSIEAGAFTGDQLRMIGEFVERRGGGLLMLGGERSFAEGGYAGTPVADALPIALERLAKAPESFPIARLRVRPTRAGEGHALAQIAATEAASLQRWSDLPALISVNPVRTLKPGATVLLNGTDEGRRTQPVLAYQRYGRGKAIAFAVKDSWLWQMHHTMALEDMTHENFWRQLLRWLVDGVPGAVEAHTTAERVEAGETVTILADVVDKTYVELNDAKVTATVQTPSGQTLEVPMQWTGERNGQYRGTYAAFEQGLYTASVEAGREDGRIGDGTVNMRAAPGDAEYFDPTMHAARLRRIADETGGRFYTAETVTGLPEDLKYTGRGVTTVEERDLWDMPIMLLALVGLMSGEWAYRRRVGMP
ncbi:MAG TPA: glutamine amidotransferase [Vicinamibacterales bacterium]|nr:glutamine amidotransferase [Vicinamibacterales bacterium]